MWSRKELKKKSRDIMKKHYWRVVAVAFIVALMAGTYSSTFSAVFFYDSSKEEENVVQENTVFDVNDIQGKHIPEWILGRFEERSREEEEIIKNSPYKEGVFSALYNYITATGSVFSGIIALILDPIIDGAWLSLISAAVGAALLFFWWLLVRNIIRVGGCRFFLEADTYNHTKGNRIFFLYRIRRVWAVARIMLRKSLYQWLWSLTVIGGWIKGYSYMMVPYLAAENPDIKGREAIRISRKMMQGNKWKAFLMDCSFLGWSLLSTITLGLVNILYANPYKAGAKAELYLALREKALASGAEYSYVFTDRYLTMPPEEEELRAAMKRQILVADTADWKLKKEQTEAVPIDVTASYPSVLFTVPEAVRLDHPDTDYNCRYGVTGIVLLFFIFSIVGWCWEVAAHIRLRRCSRSAAFKEAPGQTGGDLFYDDSDLRNNRICYQLVSGALIRCPLVGLQRLFSESERADLRRGTADLWPWRMCVYLHTGTTYHEQGHPENPHEGSADSVCCAGGAVCSRFLLFQGDTQQRTGNQRTAGGMDDTGADTVDGRQRL